MLMLLHPRGYGMQDELEARADRLGSSSRSELRGGVGVGDPCPSERDVVSVRRALPFCCAPTAFLFEDTA